MIDRPCKIKTLWQKTSGLALFIKIQDFPRISDNVLEISVGAKALGLMSFCLLY